MSAPELSIAVDPAAPMPAVEPVVAVDCEARPRVAAVCARLGRITSNRIVRHLTVFALVLVVLSPSQRLEVPAVADDGAYAYPVRALNEGSWTWDYWASDFDPEGEFFPIDGSTRSDRGWHPYVKHPAYPAMQWLASLALGDVGGLYVLSIVGAIAAAAVAGAIARVIRPGSEGYAFWIAALSPLLVNAYAAWAHTLSAALGGLAFLSGWLALSRPRRVLWASLFMISSVLHVLVRSEGLLWTAAICVAIAIGGARVGRLRLALGLGAACSGAAIATSLVERVWVNAIAPNSGGFGMLTPETADGSAAKLRSAWRVLLGYDGSTGRSGFLLFVGLGCVAVAGLVGRSKRLHALSVMFLLAATAAYLAALNATGLTITGLMLASPVIVFGIALAVGRTRADSQTMVLVAAGAFAIMVLALQYEDGGARQWGGRFLSPAIAPLAALAGVGVHRLVRSLDRSLLIQGVGALGALAVAIGGGGLRSFASFKANDGALIEEIQAIDVPIVVTDIAHLPRIGWRISSDVSWLVTPPGQVVDALTVLERQGFREAAVALYLSDDERQALAAVGSVIDRTTRPKRGDYIAVVSVTFDDDQLDG